VAKRKEQLIKHWRLSSIAVHFAPRATPSVEGATSFDAIVEWVLHRAHDLIVFVALSRDENDVPA
jgi:hypothetical protein